MGKVIFCIKSYFRDIRREVKYLFRDDFAGQGRCLAKLQLRNHVIEKGLSMPDSRPGFGKQNIMTVISLCDGYATRGFDTDEFVFRSSVALVKEYLNVHADIGFKLDDDLAEAAGNLIGQYGDIEPLHQRETDRENFFRSAADFREFALSRHSLRAFVEGEIPVETIRAAVELAMTAPSACNRQPSRVHLVCGDKVGRIMKQHRGSRGFGDRADKLIVLAVDLDSYFGVGERNLHRLDSGIFAMNLLYALHYFKVGACALNWCVNEADDRALRNLLGIPDNEVVTMLIACGELPDRKFRTAASERYKADTIMTVH